MTLSRRAQDLLIIDRLRLAARRRAKAKPGDSAPAAVDYDWEVPHHFGAAGRARLDAFAATVARAVAEKLGALLRTEVAIEARPAGERYGATVRATVEGTYRFPLAGPGGEVCGLVRLPAALAVGWVERLLGGTGAAEARELSSMEAALLVDLVAAVVRSLAAVSAEMGGPSVQHVDRMLDDDEPLPGRDEDEFCHLVFAVGERAEVVFVLASETLEPIARGSGDAEPATKAEEVPGRLAAHLAEAPVRARVELGTTEILVRDLMALEPGDVVVLNAAIEDPVQLRVGERVVAGGRPVTCEGQYAFQAADLRRHPRARV